MRSQADWTVAAWINPSVTPMLPVSLVVKKEYASSETAPWQVDGWVHWMLILEIAYK